MGNKIKVGVVFGGQSTEHEVSLVTAESVLRNMDAEKYEITMIGITKKGQWLKYTGPINKIGTGEWQEFAKEEAFHWEECKSFDVIFPLLHGCNGEDGTIQGLFELAGVPYVGSGVLGSALGMDKAYAKIIFEKENIPQGYYLTFTRKQICNNIESVIENIESKLEYPCFVKPSNAGSSIGVNKAKNRMELHNALKIAAQYDRRILVEEFINGREIECAVLGNDEPVASIVGEIIPGKEFYDYDAKYKDENSRIIIPADLPENTVELIRNYAVKAFKSLDCSGLSRVDFFVHKETGNIYINEINTMPGFTSISMYPKLWEASGLPYARLIDKLLELAVERFEDNKRLYY